MPQISAVFVGKMLAQAPAVVDRNDCLRACGLSESQLHDPQTLISAQAYFTSLERIDQASPQPPDFHIRAAASMRAEDLGAVGLAFKVAPTLGDSFKRMGRYVQLITRHQTFEVHSEGDHALVRPRRTPPASRGAQLSYEASFVTLIALARESAGSNVSPIRVRYAHLAAGDHKALQAHFGCMVEFGADEEALVFRPDVLARANVLADKGICGFLESQLDERFERVRRKRSLSEEISRWAANLFSDGPLTLAMAAGAMGISIRTLQRRLADEGRSFNSLIDAARRELAEFLLSNPRHTIAEVTFLTGFADQSAFNRAFKRWSGQTPRSFRLKQKGRSSPLPPSAEVRLRTSHE
jgi:AraC-like DNA-binding protein